MPISNWSTTASSNATADSASGISWPEGMSPAQVNDSARAMMAETRKWYSAAENKAYAEVTGTTGSISTVIPQDDTIPQITEGTQLTTVSITPSSASNKVRIRVTGTVASSVAGTNAIVAVFRGSTANAIASQIVTVAGAQYMTPFAFEVEDSPATTSAITYSIRVGPGTASNLVYFNGNSAGRYMGGSMRTAIVAQEVVV